MSTTVEVKKPTVLILEDFKRRYKAKSLDETIRILIEKAEEIPRSMFGSHPEMDSFKPEDEAGSHEL